MDGTQVFSAFSLSKQQSSESSQFGLHLESPPPGPEPPLPPTADDTVTENFKVSWIVLSESSLTLRVTSPVPETIGAVHKKRRLKTSRARRVTVPSAWIQKRDWLPRIRPPCQVTKTRSPGVKSDFGRGVSKDRGFKAHLAREQGRSSSSGFRGQSPSLGRRLTLKASKQRRFLRMTPFPQGASQSSGKASHCQALDPSRRLEGKISTFDSA